MRKKITTLITLMIITVLGIIIILNNKNKPYEITDSNNGQFAFFYEDENGEYQRSDESKWSTGEYILNFANSSCNGEKDPSFLSWNNDNNSVILMRNKATKCNLYFDRKASDFSFTGGIQEFTVPVTGTYKLEVWGAQGGTSEDYAQEGKGGYSTGTITLNSGEKLYIVTGGQGSSTEENGIYKGGFNGGGSGALGNTQYAYGGGGATHIAKSTGVLSSLSDKTNDILIVAGGGGGNGAIATASPSDGGAGGGLQGTDGINGHNGDYVYIGHGANQNSAGSCATFESNGNCGSFGQGGSAIDQICGGAGGGGGYFGGSQSTRGHAGGGGGSGYIGNSNLKNGNTIAGDSLMPSPTGGNETGHSGNGYARITLADISKVYDFSLKEEAQEFIAPINGNYKIELWGASGGDKDEYYGGKGGYTEGIINLKANDKLYIYVGGAGSNTAKGGYNGGADLNAGQSNYGSSGGGATDVRLESGNWNDFNSLKSRIMVAAGGGGANNRNGKNNSLTSDYWYGAGNGGYGGGLIGGTGQSIDNTNPENGKSYGWSTSYGGTQTKGGLYFWNGGTNGSTSPSAYSNFGYSVEGQSTGGGGYYGGAVAGHAGAGGGSSFISGYQGCVAIEESSSEENIISRCTEEDALNNISCSYHYSGKIFTNTIMKAGNEMMPSPSGGMETGHLGNGYARITLVSGSEENVELKKAVDLSGNGYDGNFIGNVQIKQDGDDGYGLYFGGNESYVELPTLPASIDWNSGFTIEFEAKWHEFNSFSRIFDFGNGENKDNLIVCHDGGINQFRIHFLHSNNVNLYLEANKKIKIKLEFTKTGENNYVANIYENDILKDSVVYNNLANLNVERKNNYLGKSNWYDEQVIDGYLHGYIYWLKITDINNNPTLWYNFS